MTRLTLRVAAVAVLAVAAGCASSPKIYTNQNPELDLGNYRTFGFEPVLGTDRARGQRSIVSTHLMHATRNELEKRGYVYQEVNPDFEVNFFLQTQEKISTSTTPTAGVGYGGYYGYRRGYYGTWGGYETTVSQYTEGTLTIDVVDTDRKMLAWEGTAVGRLKEKVRKNMAEAANRVVGEILADYPLAR